MKERLLNILEVDRDAYVSGADLRSELGITRSAVWKWMEQLRADGYVIDAVPNRGYRLVQKPDRLYPWEVRRGLETQLVGRQFYYEPVLDSTNTKARQLARDEEEEGLVVLCETQTAGRGRRGRPWVSPPHTGIYCSVLLRPQIPLQEVPQISLLTAVALQAVIEGSTIKWPNDVLIDGLKCSGILVEVDAEPDLVKAVIVGIGLNVNVLRSELPPEVQETATSLLISRQKVINRVQLLQRILTSLDHTFARFLEDGFGPVLARCKECCSTLGQEVVVQNQRGELTGKAVDIAADGALVLQEATGNLTTVYAGEVTVRART